MDVFKNILVAASPGRLEASMLRRAVALARSNSARLAVLDVVESVPGSWKQVNVEGTVVDIEDMLVRDRRDRLRHLAKRADVPADTELSVIVGEPFVEVVRHVLSHGDDLVLAGEKAVQSGDSAALSRGMMKLLRKCPVPLWVVRPSRARKQRVLALVDPDADDPAHDELNHRVLELAAALIRTNGGELHIGHAWHLSGEVTLRTSPYVGLPAGMVDLMVATAEEQHRERLDALLTQHPVDELGANVHLVAGDPREVLPQLAARLHIGLVVMGTVARTGLSGFFMGNTAEAMLGSIQCSMLAVKPEGFETPVKL